MDSQQKKIIIYVAIAIVILVVGYFVITKGPAAIINGIKNGLGSLFVSDTAPSVSQAQTTVKNYNFNGSPFDPNTYNNNPGASTMDFGTLQSVCKTINSAGADKILNVPIDQATGGNMSDVYNVMKANCQNQIDISNVAQVFSQMYNVGLVDFLFINNNFLGNNNIVMGAQLINWAASLPQA